MSTTLPRISPASTPGSPKRRFTPVSTPCSPMKSHSAPSLYGPYPPPELSSSMDLIRIPARINPLAPPPPRKRINRAWETIEQHWHNEKRSSLMQQREHTRYHSAWEKPFYGAPAEREQYRKHFREVLKRQMTDKEMFRRQFLKDKVKESEMAVAYDNDCLQKDAEKVLDKYVYLRQFRDGNKSMMEDRWDVLKFNKVLEDKIDREKLRYNPINWSCTLK